MGTRPPKLEKTKVLNKISKAIKEGLVRTTLHAEERMRERNISWFEIKAALESGYNERAKDSYTKEFGCWTYSIRFDLIVSESEKRRLRIPVAFDSDGTIVVTAIDIDQDETP